MRNNVRVIVVCVYLSAQMILQKHNLALQPVFFLYWHHFVQTRIIHTINACPMQTPYTRQVFLFLFCSWLPAVDCYRRLSGLNYHATENFGRLFHTMANFCMASDIENTLIRSA